MSKRLYKHTGLDKFDAYMPKKHDFFHDDYYVSSHQELFHVPAAYGYVEGGGRRGFSFGIQSKMWKATGQGINIDNHGVGQSDT